LSIILSLQKMIILKLNHRTGLQPVSVLSALDLNPPALAGGCLVKPFQRFSRGSTIYFNMRGIFERESDQ
jgi:hypothetical protein